jgi:hypothetical protein
MDDLPKKIGSHIEEEKLKKLADKFVTYFSGTFQCNVGHQVIIRTSFNIPIDSLCMTNIKPLLFSVSYLFQG